MSASFAAQSHVGEADGPRVAADVTACIPTFRRSDHLATTLAALLGAQLVPRYILVSEGSGESEAVESIRAVLRADRLAPSVEIRLLEPPPCGTRCGNRNWIAAHVTTRYLLFIDDDVDLPVGFLAAALLEVTAGSGNVVATGISDKAHGHPSTMTRRGHFRMAEPGDEPTLTLMASLWPTDTFTGLWLDEVIAYGYEDADIADRLRREGRRIVPILDHPYTHRAYRQSVGVGSIANRDALADRARCYVTLRRAYPSRMAIAKFLGEEATANLLARRRLLPPGQVNGQWQRAIGYLLHRSPPPWLVGATVAAHLARDTTSSVR